MRNSGSECQARERKPSKTWAAKIAALNKPITAVTVSIITNILPPLHARENDTDPCTVKKIPGRNRRSRWSDDLVQQVRTRKPAFARKEAEPFVYQPTLTFAFPTTSPHFRRVPAAICLSLGAEAGCTGGNRPISLPVVGRIGRSNGNWGTWGLERQIG